MGYWFTHWDFLLSKLLLYNSCLGFYFHLSQAWKDRFLGLSGFRLVIGLPIGIIYFQSFYFKFPFGLLFLWKLGILVWLGIDLIVWLFVIVS